MLQKKLIRYVNGANEQQIFICGQNDTRTVTFIQSEALVSLLTYFQILKPNKIIKIFE